MKPILLPMVLFVVACGVSVGPGERPEIAYYHLALAEPEPAAERLELDLAIMPFGQAGALDRDGIRYRLNEVEGGYWADHRWAEPVSSMVRSSLRTDFSRSGLFRRVVLVDTAAYARAVLTGEVTRFGEEDREDGWYGVIAIDFDLVLLASADPEDEEEDRVILSRRYQQSVRAADRTVPEVVRALSRALHEICGELRADLLAALEEEEG